MIGGKVKIGELSVQTGVSADALRFYEKIGLIGSVRSSNGYRHYPEQMIQLVRYISTAKKLGFTLAEIGQQVPQILGKESPAQALGELFMAKAAMIDQRIEALTILKQELLQRMGSGCPLLPSSPAPESAALSVLP
jgi:DNA-binding transcriptional MerR regulator